jgi:hypothetical protein
MASGVGRETDWKAVRQSFVLQDWIAVKTLVEAIRELTGVLRTIVKPHKHVGNCEFCKAPSIEAKFRLMEAAYHEDMDEVYRRLAKLETKCLNP